mmetsp:Transcript_19552/g.50932  ORF Transcript_19552/g.50932 Transcript_19552/m.50932 type:complete len:241 (+) Transcript_19552:156-878(+)
MASSNSPGAHLQKLKKNLKSSGRLMPALTRFAASARPPRNKSDPPSRRAPATSSHAWIIVALSPPYSPPMKSRFSASSLSSSKPFAASPIVSSVGESSDTPSDPRSVCSTTKTAACRRKWLYSLRGASTTCPAAARCTGATLLMSVLFSACTMRGRRRGRMRRRIDGARKALLVLDVNHSDPGSLSLAANNSNARQLPAGMQLAECKTLGIWHQLLHASRHCITVESPRLLRTSTAACAT